jgi:cell division protein FtsB
MVRIAPLVLCTVIARKFDLIVLAACASLLGYFAWHAFEGPRGFAHMEALKMKAGELAREQHRVAGERDALDRRVGLVRPEATDPDIVDELARVSLGFVRPGDLVVIDSPTDSIP